jgi:hypothetical protein
MNRDLNEIIISGTINNITDNNKEYIKFGLTTLKYDNNKVYSSLNINRNLYEIYKDFFVKGNQVFIKGYLNSYILNNKIQSFISVLDISDNKQDILIGKSAPHIRYDPDGVEVWNGKRCEMQKATKEEQEKMKKMLSKFK